MSGQVSIDLLANVLAIHMDGEVPFFTELDRRLGIFVG
jgi:hypothetical protein